MFWKPKKILEGKQFYNADEAVSHYAGQKDLLPKENIAFDYIPRNSKILDFGCGSGRTTEVLRGRGHDTTGVDFSFAMLKTARSDGRDIPYIAGDASSLSFQDMLFDVVLFSYNGIDCIYPHKQRLKALQEIKRVLKPGGLFIFSSHNHCFPRDRDGVIPFMKALFKKERNTHIVDTCNAWGGCKIYLTTPSLQIKEVQQAGFDLIKLVPRRILRNVKSLAIIGLIDSYVYYVCRSR